MRILLNTYQQRLQDSIERCRRDGLSEEQLMLASLESFLVPNSQGKENRISPLLSEEDTNDPSISTTASRTIANAIDATTANERDSTMTLFPDDAIQSLVQIFSDQVFFNVAEILSLLDGERMYRWEVVTPSMDSYAVFSPDRTNVKKARLVRKKLVTYYTRLTKMLVIIWDVELSLTKTYHLQNSNKEQMTPTTSKANYGPVFDWKKKRFKKWIVNMKQIGLPRWCGRKN